MIVYAIIDERSPPSPPLGDSIEVFVRHEDAERFIEEYAATISSWPRSSDRGARGPGFLSTKRFGPDLVVAVPTWYDSGSAASGTT